MNEQQQLRYIYDAIIDGRFPVRIAPLGPDFARRLAAYRERVEASVHVIDASSERMVLLCAPVDGSPLYLWQFDALSSSFAATKQ